MKTAISVPDHVYAEAERLAKKLKKSRSQLYSEAMAEYLARRCEDEVTASWRAVLAEGEDEEDQAMAAFRREAVRQGFERTEW